VFDRAYRRDVRAHLNCRGAAITKLLILHNARRGDASPRRRGFFSSEPRFSVTRIIFALSRGKINNQRERERERERERGGGGGKCHDELEVEEKKMSIFRARLMFAYADCGAYGFLCLFFYFSFPSENSEMRSGEWRRCLVRASREIPAKQTAKVPRAAVGNDSEAEAFDDSRY